MNTLGYTCDVRRLAAWYVLLMVGATYCTSALLMAVAAFAEREGVMSELRDEWERSQPGLANRLAGSAVGTAPKAWRFVGEMEEIAAAFERHDLPTGFHRGAADLYEMLAVFRDEAPSFGEVAELLSGRRS